MEYVIDHGRRQRKRQVVHQSLLEIAHGLFRERGIAGTTVDDIVEAADVARQTFFNHFPCKEALAVELASEHVHEIAQRSQVLLEAHVPSLDVLQRAAEWVLDRAIEDGEIAVAASRELLHPDPVRAMRAAEKVPLDDVFEGILLQAREEGAIRSDLSPRLVARRLSAILRCMIAQIPGGSPEHLRGELALTFDIIFNGIIDRST